MSKTEKYSIIYSILFIYRLKTLQNKTNGLRLSLKNNQAELHRLCQVYDNWDVIPVKGSNVDLTDWLVSDRPKRKAKVNKSPDPSQPGSQSDFSQGTEDSVGAQSNVSYGDDVTEDGEDDETSKRSGDTETGRPDTQETEESYDDVEERRKKKKAKKKSAKKEKRRMGKQKKKEAKAKAGYSEYDSPSY